MRALRVMICGQRGRGKDTLAQILLDLVPGMERHAFADPLKDQTAALLDAARIWYCIPYPRIDRAYIDAHRDQFGPLWQWYGTEFARAADKDYWVKEFERNYGYIPSLVVPDYRFPNEAQWGRDNGFTLIKVVGPNRRSDADHRDDNHASERFLDELPFDIQLDNSVNDSGYALRHWAQAFVGAF